MEYSISMWCKFDLLKSYPWGSTLASKELRWEGPTNPLGETAGSINRRSHRDPSN